MYYVYVLISIEYGTRYIGYSSDPEKRLVEQHNTGKVRYTKGRLPWKLLYKEVFRTRSEAMKRGKFFKSGQGRLYLDDVLKHE